MVASTFARGCALTLVYEGGKVDNPRDPGGRTNQGVTQRTYDAWRRRKGVAKRDVYLMEAGERNAIYRQGYADPIHYDELPAGLDYATFDFSIHSGPARAAKELQTVVGVEADGIIGNITLAAVTDAVKADEEGIIRRLCERRLAFMQHLSAWDDFGNGWRRRVVGKVDGVQSSDIGVIDYATMMARNYMSFGLPSAPAPGKAWPADVDAVDMRLDLIAAAKTIIGIADRLPSAA